VVLAPLSDEAFSFLIAKACRTSRKTSLAVIVIAAITGMPRTHAARKHRRFV